MVDPKTQIVCFDVLSKRDSSGDVRGEKTR
jgi:hypothetical protein